MSFFSIRRADLFQSYCDSQGDSQHLQEVLISRHGSWLARQAKQPQLNREANTLSQKAQSLETKPANQTSHQSTVNKQTSSQTKKTNNKLTNQHVQASSLIPRRPLTQMTSTAHLSRQERLFLSWSQQQPMSDCEDQLCLLSQSSHFC